MIGSAAPSRPERRAPATSENGLYVSCAVTMLAVVESTAMLRQLHAIPFR